MTECLTPLIFRNPEHTRQTKMETHRADTLSAFNEGSHGRTNASEAFQGKRSVRDELDASLKRRRISDSVFPFYRDDTAVPDTVSPHSPETSFPDANNSEESKDDQTEEDELSRINWSAGRKRGPQGLLTCLYDQRRKRLSLTTTTAEPVKKKVRFVSEPKLVKVKIFESIENERENVYRTMHMAQQPNATEGMDLKKSEAQFERQSLQLAVDEEISHHTNTVDENPWFLPPVTLGLPPPPVNPRGRDSIEKIRILAESAREISVRSSGSLSVLQLNRENAPDSPEESEGTQIKFASLDTKVVPANLPTPSQATAVLNVLTSNGPLPDVVGPPTTAPPVAAPSLPQPVPQPSPAVLTSKDVSSFGAQTEREPYKMPTVAQNKSTNADVNVEANMREQIISALRQANALKAGAATVQSSGSQNVSKGGTSQTGITGGLPRETSAFPPVANYSQGVGPSSYQTQGAPTMSRSFNNGSDNAHRHNSSTSSNRGPTVRNQDSGARNSHYGENRPSAPRGSNRGGSGPAQNPAPRRYTGVPVVPCRFFLNGHCHKGVNCTFLHEKP